MFCRFCGKEIEDGSIFCRFCGKKIDIEPHTEKAAESDLMPDKEESVAEPAGNVVDEEARNVKDEPIEEEEIGASLTVSNVKDVNDVTAADVDPEISAIAPVNNDIDDIEIEAIVEPVKKQLESKTEIESNSLFSKAVKAGKDSNYYNSLKPKTTIIQDKLKQLLSTKNGKVIFGCVCAAIVLLFCFTTHIICFHNWAEATCTNPRTCTICGRTRGSALGHDYSEATCTIPQKCKVCGEIGNEALGHEIKDWKVDSEATCEKTGKRHGKCERCGEEITENLAALGHNWSDWVSDGGNQTRTCSRCKKEESREMPAISSGSQTVLDNDNLKVIFNADSGYFEFINKTSTSYIIDFTWGASQITLNGNKLNPWDMSGGTLSGDGTLNCYLTLARDGETLAGEKMHEGDYIKDGNNTLSVQFEYGEPDKDFTNIVDESTKKIANFTVKVDKSVVDRW